MGTGNQSKSGFARSGIIILAGVLLGVGLWPISGGIISFAQGQKSTPYVLKLPPGVLEPIIPEDNPLSVEKVALGKTLFFDKRLSVDNTISCAACHDHRLGFADGKKVAEGIQQKKGARNSPTTLNTAFLDTQFWDGRASSLEEQAKGPLVNPVEMGMPSHDALVTKLRKIPEYRRGFQEVFGTEDFTIDHVAKAIASFERTLNTFNSPFDRFIGGDKGAISPSAQRGWELFQGKARCITCHEFNTAYPFFTDNKFHNIGVATKAVNFEALARRAAVETDVARLAREPGAAELGRYLATQQPKNIGAFKTPGLREIAHTAPYMHDGSEPTLETVIEFYDKGGIPNPNLDGGMRPLGLTMEEKKALVEFLKALTSDDLPSFVKDLEGMVGR